MADDKQAGKSRLIKNSIFSLIAWVFPILLGFVATPILVHGLGAEQYGIFAIVLGFISYSFTFGVGKVVAKFIPEFLADGESKKVSEVISATFMFSVVIGLAGFSVLAVLTRTVVNDLLLISTENQDVAAHALYLACGIGFMTMLSQVFQFVLQGLHRFRDYVILANLSGLLIGIGNIIFVLSGFGVVTILVWNLFIVSVIGLMFYKTARKYVPDFTFSFRVRREMTTAVLRYGGNIILFQIFANILFIFERTWLVRKFGPQGLTAYFVPMLLAIYMHGMMASFVQAVFPVVNELLRDRDKLIDLYKKATKLVFAIIVFMVATFICSGYTLLSLWVSPELAAGSYSLLVIHSITFGLIAVCIISLQVAEAFKFSILNAIVTGTWMFISIPLMIYWAGIYNSEGIALARLATVVLTFPLLFFVEWRFLGSVLGRFWLAISSRAALATLAAVAIQYFVLNHVTANRPVLVAVLGLSGLVYLGSLVLVGYFTAEEKKMARSMILRKYGREI